MAGGYGVKNNKNSRDFLNMWANLEHGHPEGFHRWSSCALNSSVSVICKVKIWIKNPCLVFWQNSYIPSKSITPARTHSTGGLKSKNFNLKMMVKNGLELFCNSFGDICETFTGDLGSEFSQIQK